MFKGFLWSGMPTRKPLRSIPRLRPLYRRTLIFSYFGLLRSKTPRTRISPNTSRSLNAFYFALGWFKGGCVEGTTSNLDLIEVILLFCNGKSTSWGIYTGWCPPVMLVFNPISIYFYVSYTIVVTVIHQNS